jgi:hypothetical protein
MFSAVAVVFNSCFVLIANGMKLGETIGHVVLATNISVMLLFGLNTVSWALGSRAMSRLYIPSGGTASAGATGMTDVFLRLGIITAVLLALCARPLLDVFLPEYAGSAQLILYFCMFQSYGLLLFSESTFLNVNSRLLPVLAGYGFVMSLLGIAFLTGQFDFLTIVRGGVLLHFSLAIGIALFARRLGFAEGRLRERLAALCFPALCMLADALAGPFAVVAVCVTYLVANVSLHRQRIVPLLGKLVHGKT